jgi:DNA primase
MPHVPNELISRIKETIPLADLCRDYGIILKSHGADLVGHCPFHDDTTPSFVVTPAKNLWHCLGACQAGGDIITLMMKKEKLSFRHAVEKLQQKAGLAPVITAKTKLGKEHPVLVEPSTVLTDTEMLARVLDFYHQTFLNDPKAMRYLEQRKCFHPEAVKTFKLGYANRTIGYRVPPPNTKVGKPLKEQLQRVGILRQSTGHEHLSGSAVFPIWNSNGEIVQMYGRKVTHWLREGTPLHLYLPGDLRGVWNGPALEKQREWLLCESIIDALSFWCQGFRNVTCAYGVNGFTADHWALLRLHRPGRVVICYDNDEAGNSAAKKLAGELSAEGFQVWRATPPEGKDINDIVRNARNPQATLATMLDTADFHRTLAQPPPPSPKAAAREELPPEPPPGETPKHVAMVVDELTDEPLPIVDKTSLETGMGWAPEPFTPASLAEVEKQNAVTPSLAAPSQPPPTAAESLTSTAPLRLDVPVTRQGDDILMTVGDRQWRVRGLDKNLSFEVMKVNVRVLRPDTRTGEPCYYVDTLDLLNARHRQVFVNAAAVELQMKSESLRKDLGRVLLKLEQLQEDQIKAALEPQQKEVRLTTEEREAALSLLKDPKLLDRILSDFERCGSVGEENNKLVGYLAAVSRKLDEPLAVIIQSTSAAGKSMLLESILALVPDEDRVKYSAMTGQSLFYMGDTNLKHKILAIVEEEGAENATYALKLLQSEGELTIASTGKDPATGRMVTQEYHVEGPVMMLLTTTAIDIDEELLNRCLVLTVDESREQTRRIHELQRARYTLEGWLARAERDEIRKLHRNAQRLLQPLAVVNPFAKQLTFLDDKTRTRRDHEKYLRLMVSIALLHQYQREVKTKYRNEKPMPYIEVTREDIATANRLAAEILGRCLDELPPQTRRFLCLLDDMVKRACEEKKIARVDHRFTQRDARAFTGWSQFQIKVHLAKLADLEYVLVHRGGRGQSFVYELLYEGQGRNGKPFLMGLIDVERLAAPPPAEPEPSTPPPAYDGDRVHENGQWEHEKTDREQAGSPVVAHQLQGGSVAQSSETLNENRASEALVPQKPENASGDTPALSSS